MSDDDLIRRGDVLREIANEGLHILDAAIAALPARGVGVDAVAVKNAVMGWVWAEDSDVSKRLGPKHTDALIARILAALEPAPTDAAQAREAAIRECADALRKVIDYAAFAGADPDEVEDAAINSYADYLLTLIGEKPREQRE